MTATSQDHNFRSLLLYISEQLTDDDLRKLKFLCDREKVGEGELSKIQSGFELFNKLITNCHLSKTDTYYLQKLLNIRPDLRKKVVNFQQCATSAVEAEVTSSSSASERLQLHPGFPCEVRNFTGRDAEVNDIIAAIVLNDAKLLILKSPPGFGKSAVAKQVAYSAIRNGLSVIFVCLRQYTSLACACTKILHFIEGPDVKLSDDVIAQAQNKLSSLEKQTLLILDNTEDLQNSDSSPEFAKFVKFLGSHSRALHLFLTSRQEIREVLFHYDKNLEPLDSISAARLLVTMATNTMQNIEDDTAKELAKLCGQIPLLLEFAAKKLRAMAPLTLAQHLKENLYSALTSGDQFGYVQKTVRFFLQSLQENYPWLLASLIKLSRFSASFTSTDAAFFFKDDAECAMQISSLYDNALVQKEDSESYSLHPVIQTFCREEELPPAFSEVRRKAVRLYNKHFLGELNQLHKDFVSKNCQEAIQRFHRIGMNIKEAYRSCLEKGSDDMKKECIEAFNECINFLGKVLQPKHCHEMYNRLHLESTALQNKKLASDCLISMGFRFMCDVGHREFSQHAKDLLQDAYNIQMEVLKKKERKTEIFAHCCSKFGLCCIWEGDRQKGKRLLEKALGIRREIGDQVLIGASFCDKATAARICGERGQAISLLQEHCLPRYTEQLGDHPWTATVHNYISDDFSMLGNWGEAAKHSRLAIDMREKLLGRHQDTARSYTKLGEILLRHEYLEEARKVFHEALSIQEEVLGSSHLETIKTCKYLVGILERIGEVQEAATMKEKEAAGENSRRNILMQEKQISKDVKERTRSISAEASRPLCPWWIVVLSVVVAIVGVLILLVNVRL